MSKLSTLTTIIATAAATHVIAKIVDGPIARTHFFTSNFIMYLEHPEFRPSRGAGT